MNFVALVKCSSFDMSEPERAHSLDLGGAEPFYVGGLEGKTT